MKLLSGKRIGQSGYELALAVFFSFFLHAAIIVASLFLYMAASPKKYVPPFYNVKLVGLPADTAPAPVQQTAPLPPPLETPKTKAAEKPKVEKARPKSRRSSSKAAQATSKKGAMAELNQKKPKAVEEQEKPVETETPQSAPVAGKANPASGAVDVAVKPQSESFKFPYYMDSIHNNIERNWNPPPGIQGMKVKVVFRVLRSGRVFGDVNIEESSGNLYFDMAAKRAILSSSPFPPMPDDFYGQYAEFSVDLVEKE